MKIIPMNKILYVSNLCSVRTFGAILNNTTIKPSLAGQKYHKLLASGISLQTNTLSLDAFSRIPVISKSHSKIIWNLPIEKFKKMTIQYFKMINLPVLSSLSLLIGSFLKTMRWAKYSGNKVIVCDILSFSISTGALFAAKICSIDCIGIITDLPDRVITTKNSKRLGKITSKAVKYFMGKYDGYVLMTEQMNQLINTKKKPYRIIEGMVDCKIKMNSVNVNKKSTKIILYSGGLYEEYGVKVLIEAFMLLSQKNISLSIYGSGSMVNDIKRFSEIDSRIHYYGVIANDEVVKAQQKATLLVNVRPSDQEYTKYSFPSKNIEYMASGTAVATTILPGIPAEYYDYVYVLDTENIEGIRCTLDTILSKPFDELKNKGASAKAFVINHKSNYHQAHKISQIAEEIAVFRGKI
jgi:glycosyltransferase involved in cell wall biosynthesis